MENINMQQNVKDQELANCYFIKSVLMILVVFYHSVAFWISGGWFNQAPAQNSQMLSLIAEWLNSFHIYGFTLVSGYIFYAVKYEHGKYQSYKAFIYAKAKRLLIPYCFVTVVWAMPSYVYYFKPSGLNIVRKYILMEGPSQLWFLIMLFGVFVIYYPIAEIINRRFVAGIVFGLFIYGIGIVGSHFIPNFFQIWSVLRFLIFFHTGVLLRKYGMKRLMRVQDIIYVITDLILFIGYELLLNKSGIFWKIIMLILHLGLNVIGAVGVFVLLQKAAIKIKHFCMAEFFDKYSMTIYLFHQQFIYIILEIGNGCINNYYLVLLNFLAALLGAGGISVVLHKYSVTRYLVTGRKE